MRFAPRVVSVCAVAFGVLLCARAVSAQSAPSAPPSPSGDALGSGPVVQRVDFSGDNAGATRAPSVPARPIEPDLDELREAGDRLRAREDAEIELARYDLSTTGRRVQQVFAGMGAGILGQGVGATPGILMIVLGGSCGYSTCPVLTPAGVVLAIAGALAGGSFGNALAAHSVGNATGRGRFWPTYGGALAGYVVTAAFTASLATPLLFGGSAVGASASAVVASAVGATGMVVVPPLFAMGFYDMSSEAELRPLRELVRSRQAYRVRPGTRTLASLTPTVQPLQASDGRVVGVSLGLAGLNF